MSNPYRKVSQKRPIARKSVSRKAPRRVAARRKANVSSRNQERLFDRRGDFNPQSFDRPASRGLTRSANNRRMFNAGGQINAYDKADALTQISHLLNNVTKKNAHELSMHNVNEPQMSKEARYKVLAAALNDPTGQGFHMVGQELALPIKAILDYEGFARRMYRVRKLGQAELFRIPKDIRSVAYIIGGDGQTPEARIKTKWITPEEFKITSFPTIDIQDIYQMNFDVLDRAQDTARQEIELQEDKAAINLLDRAATTVNATTTFASLGIGAFEDVRYQVERHRLLVENFWINRQELSDIVKNMSTAVDPVTERELILAGYIGNILNAQILTAAGTGVEEVISAGTFYATTGPDYLGEMGERISLFSEPYNKYAVKETVKGWAFVEMVGFAIPNAKAVAKGSK